jgi:hypothetical protein
MDILALERRKALPVRLSLGGSAHLQFTHWTAVIWIAWALALVVLALKVHRSLPALRAWLRSRQLPR